MSEKLTRVFIYGSLKRGHMHHGELTGAVFVGLARTEVGYGLVRYENYPALVEQERGSVEGELFEVDSRLLARLDAFEDCPELYQRSRIRLTDGSEVQAYTMTAEAVRHCERVPGDRWREE